MATNKKNKMTIKIDVARMMRAASREIFGTPGGGRKTGFEDRKKRADKRACRGRCTGEE